MTLDYHKRHPDMPIGDAYQRKAVYGLRFIDFLPSLTIIIVAVLVGIFLTPGATEAETLRFFEKSASKAGIMIVVGLCAVAALYFTYRSAQRTAEREAMRSQASALLARLDQLENITSQNP